MNQSAEFIQIASSFLALPVWSITHPGNTWFSTALLLSLLWSCIVLSASCEVMCAMSFSLGLPDVLRVMSGDTVALRNPGTPKIWSKTETEVSLRNWHTNELLQAV